MLYLASTSPRRRSLLESVGIPFTTVEPGEEPRGSGTPVELARLRARAKARGAQITEPGALVLAVDTVVDLDGCELGKPRDRADAAAMLRALSGREHQVHSASCVRRLARDEAVEWLDVSTARVSCSELSEDQIESYLALGEWVGKAGAYGIQGEAGRFMRLRCGEIDTVIGLAISPLRALLSHNSEAGWL